MDRGVGGPVLLTGTWGFVGVRGVSWGAVLRTGAWGACDADRPVGFMGAYAMDRRVGGL